MRLRVAATLAIAVVIAAVVYLYIEVEYGGETCIEASSGSPTTVEVRC